MTLLKKRSAANVEVIHSQEPEKPEPPPLAAIPDDPYALEIQLGMTRFAQVNQERDSLRRELHAAHQQIDRMEIQIEQAREHERMHVQKIIDERTTEASSLRAEIRVLNETIGNMREEMVRLNSDLLVSRGREMQLRERVALVRAACQQTLDDSPDPRDEKEVSEEE